MNTTIKNAKTIDMNKINSRINLSLNGTQESLEFINQILPFVKERMPLRINVQKNLMQQQMLLLKQRWIQIMAKGPKFLSKIVLVLVLMVRGQEDF